MKLKNVTLVIHDWGSGLGFNYAATHPSNVKAIAFMESLFRPFTSELIPKEQRPMLEKIRTPGVGEKMLMEQNMFLVGFLQSAFERKITVEEMKHYLEPYPRAELRKPIWRWSNEIPVGGKPKDVHDVVASYHAWLKKTGKPKLLLHASQGIMIGEAEVKWLKENLKNLETVDVGKGLHFIQEDAPHEIGAALAAWYQKLN